MIDLSGEADFTLLSELVAAMRDVCDVDFLLVGATARDVVLRVHGIPPARKTNDVDFAFAVRDWPQFARTRERLVQSGRFVAGSDHQRLVFSGIPVDLIPFGPIEDQQRHVTWPSSAVMNVMGFEEADRAAQRMLLPNRLEIRVPGIPSLLVLKLAAWGDKKRDKDATDIELLAAHYGDISQERLLGDEMTTYSDLSFDLVLAGASLLGRDARGVLDGPKCGDSVQTLGSILEPEVDIDGQLRLATKMSASIDRSRQMLEQILRGLRQA